MWLGAALIFVCLVFTGIDPTLLACEGVASSFARRGGTSTPFGLLIFSVGTCTFVEDAAALT